MGVLPECWLCCVCSGVGRSERVKSRIFASKGPALAGISLVGGRGGGGVGFLIHRNLLLTTHANLPTVAAAEAADIRLCHGRLPARLVPQRFFITSSILDLTIVGLDTMDVDSSSQVQQPHYLKACCKTSLELGTVVYLLGYTDREELTVGEAKVVVATDNLIKLSASGITWCPGSAGFDIHGNLAFMEGSLDEVSKPKLPLALLLSTEHSENSGASITLPRMLKTTEENGDASSSLLTAHHSKFHPGSSSSANRKISYDENPIVDLRLTHEQRIPTAEVFVCTESPEKKEHASAQLSDSNIPPKVPTSILLPLPLRQMMLSDEVDLDGPRPRNRSSESGFASHGIATARLKAYHKVPPVGTWKNDFCSDEQLPSSSHLELLDDGFESGEETMYSAETMESRNIPSPQEKKLLNAGRSQSCVNYSRWNRSRQNSAAAAAGKAALKKQNTIIPVRKSSSKSPALPQRSHDYCSMTVSSSMKKRNSSEQMMRPRRSIVQVSPRWMF